MGTLYASTYTGLPLLLQDSTASYIYGPVRMLIEAVQNGSTPTPYHYHADQLGSIRALTNQAGSVVNTYSYDAYGNTTSSSGTVYNPFKYAGEYQDTRATSSISEPGITTPQHSSS